MLCVIISDSTIYGYFSGNNATIIVLKTLNSASRLKYIQLIGIKMQYNKPQN